MHMLNRLLIKTNLIIKKTITNKAPRFSCENTGIPPLLCGLSRMPLYPIFCHLKIILQWKYIFSNNL